MPGNSTSTDDAELKDVVAHIACLFAGFIPNDYWKLAITSQHSDATAQAMALLKQQTDAARANALVRIDPYIAPEFRELFEAEQQAQAPQAGAGKEHDE